MFAYLHLSRWRIVTSGSHRTEIAHVAVATLLLLRGLGLWRCLNRAALSDTELARQQRLNSMSSLA